MLEGGALTADVYELVFEVAEGDVDKLVSGVNELMAAAAETGMPVTMGRRLSWQAGPPPAVRLLVLNDPPDPILPSRLDVQEMLFVNALLLSSASVASVGVLWSRWPASRKPPVRFQLA